MKQIRYVEETNGLVGSDIISTRYKGRDLYEDRVIYKPTQKRSVRWTHVHIYNVDRWIVRRYISPKEIKIAYPNATEFYDVVEKKHQIVKTSRLTRIVVSNTKHKSV